MAVWARWNGADRWVAQASTRPAQQTGWSGPADLSTSGVSVDGVEVATNTFGSRFVATWTARPRPARRWSRPRSTRRGRGARP